MSDIAFPVGVCPRSFSMRQQVAQRAFMSPDSGSEQVVDRKNDRWLVSFSLASRKHEEAALIEAFIASLRGQANTVALYHWVRPRPRGTMRGAPTAQAANAGAQALTINTTPGATLLAGDMIGVGGLLLQLAAPAQANGSGVMAVQVVNCLRVAITNGTPVVWDKPTAPFRLVSASAVTYVPGYAAEVPFDFAEAIG